MRTICLVLLLLTLCTAAGPATAEDIGWKACGKGGAEAAGKVLCRVGRAPLDPRATE